MSKINFKSLIIVIYIVITNCVFCQTSIDNEKAHRRYWYYRTRLINDFMKIGKDQGDCVVFAERNDGYDGINDVYSSKVGPDQIDITNQYIMALCLEYKILSRNNQNTRETIKEIYHLLYTINRLDLEAEQFFSSPVVSGQDIQPNGPLNGFILREDMPFHYIRDNFTHYNYELLENEGKNGGFTGIMHTDTLSIDNKFSGYSGYGIGTQDLTDLTLVQDKYMSMLVAMEFVNKYIPSTENYNMMPFQDGEISIKQQAHKIANRCYGYLKNKNGLWSLHYKDLNDNYLFSLSVGSSAYLYSWPLSRMTCWANNAFPWNVSSYFGSCGAYNDPMSLSIGVQSYNNLSSNPNNLGEDNAVFMAWCQSGSNLPATVSPIGLPNVGGGIGTPTPAELILSANTSVNNIEWADLLRKVLHQNGFLPKQLSVYANAIEQAPCQGPYNYGGCVYGGWEWSSQDRLEHPKARGAECGPTSNGAFKGNYPGVDYMLLHNLYYEYQNQLLDGNNGNVGNTLGGNIVSTIYNAANQLGDIVSGWLGNGNPMGSGNGGTGSTFPVVGYQNAYNYMDNSDENIWPRRVYQFVGPSLVSITQGISSEKGKVAVFQNLKSTAHIYYTISPAAPGNITPSDVTYRAGKEIVFLPGFQVDAGSTFHGYIARYTCSGNSDAMIMRHSNTLNDSLYNYLFTNDYEGDNINPVPIHYVKSPKSDSDLHPVVSENTNDSEINQVTNFNYIPNGSDFLVSPNPSKGVFKIHTKKTTDDEKLSVKVYDMKGQLVFSLDDISEEQEINLSFNSKGIYLAQVISSSGYTKNKKIEITD